MVQVLEQRDVVDILAAFERSGFDHLAVTFGATRIAASRRAAPVGRDASDGAPQTSLPARHAVRAPRLGIFRIEQANPGEFALRPGGAVTRETRIGTIRTRADITPVHAGQDGTIAGVLAGDGDFVEYGQVLVHLEPVEEPLKGISP